MVSIILRDDFFFRFSSLYKAQTSALKTLHDFTDQVIQARRQKIISKENDVCGSNESIGEKRKTTFLDILLQARIEDKPLSDLDIREEVDTFMFEVW